MPSSDRVQGAPSSPSGHGQARLAPWTRSDSPGGGRRGEGRSGTKRTAAVERAPLTLLACPSGEDILAALVETGPQAGNPVANVTVTPLLAPGADHLRQAPTPLWS